MAKKEQLALRLTQVSKHKWINTSEKAMLNGNWSFPDKCLYSKINYLQNN